ALLVGLPGRERLGGPAALASAVAPFSRMAVVCVVVLAATGLLRALAELAEPADLIDTPYGQALLVKLALVALALALGALNFGLVARRLVAAGRSPTETHFATWRRRLTATVTGEVALLAGTLLATGLLTSLPPAREAFGAGLVARARADDLRLVLAANPGQPGFNAFDLYVRDELGRPVLDAQKVALVFTMVEHDMGETEAVAEHVGDGRYAVQGGFMPMAGTWTVEASVRRAGRDDARAPLSLAAAPPASPSGAASITNPVPSDPASLARGRAIYLQNCAACHGLSGRGDGPAGRALQPRPADFRVHMAAGHTDAELFGWVSGGVAGTAMPAFGERLSAAERWDVVNFIRTFAPGASPAPAALATAVQATPAALSTARPPPLPRRLIFAQEGGLLVLEPGGDQPRRLTSFPGGGPVADPAVSPDGRTIAYSGPGDAPGSQDLRLVGSDGAADRRLLAAEPAGAVLRAPAWAPDGRRLYFASSVYEGMRERLRVERVDAGGAGRTLVREGAADPAVSPDGRWLAYVLRDGQGLRPALLAESLDGAGTRTLVPAGTFDDLLAPRYSPDGAFLAFGAASSALAPATPASALRRLVAPVAEAHGIPWDLWRVGADGQGLERLTDLNEDLIQPAWSPDGGWIAFSAEGGLYALSLGARQLYRLAPGLYRGGVAFLP
ncbi:MAG TPA: CopD family protein, partial [Chloroflexota bacterium]